MRFAFSGLRFAFIAALTLLVLAAPAYAAFPGVNGKIVFSGRGQLYSIYPFGAGQSTLTFGKAPAWSPDGTKIAFATSGIHTINPDGTGDTALTSGTEGTDSEPAWSPDGSQIAFARVPNGFIFPEIWVMNSDGSGQRSMGASGSSPAFSPDGYEIAYGYQRISVMRSDGSDAPGVSLSGNLFPDTVIDRDPSWSPDSNKIAFASNRSGNFDIWVMDRNGSGKTRLTDTPTDELKPSWSPDGKQILFTSDREDPFQGCDPDGRPCHFKLYVMNADGTGQTKLSDAALGGNVSAYADDRGDWQRLPIKPYVRPRGASPFETFLVPAYRPCSSPNRTHGPPLADGSCSPPLQTSDYLTVGTPDSNLQAAQSVGSISFRSRLGNPSTPANEADVVIGATVTDVRNKADLSDYVGELDASTMLRLTDRQNHALPSGSIGSVGNTSPITVTTTSNHQLATGAHVRITGVFGATCANGTWTITVISYRQFTLDGSTGCGSGIGGTWQSADPQAPDQGTVQDFDFSFAVPCAGTSNTGIGSTCSVSTTANALEPGAVVESQRTIWQLGQVQLYDGGADGVASTAADNTLFLDQGLFVP